MVERQHVYVLRRKKDEIETEGGGERGTNEAKEVPRGRSSQVELPLGSWKEVPQPLKTGGGRLMSRGR